ncbi:DMT family transporter [Streptomyces flavofungini]|uniref:DMT family transporter n=1 Tax=Streptomyces flavofungini TaxID=68200 RepID=UPI0025AFAC5B|nr:DMT family transporter [Streptomyces flavofungini]WJV45163.1 DMT family transporter [Streptomyces flavofungini]
MSATLLAVLLSLVSAAAYATAAVAQQRLAARMADAGGRVARLLGSGAWWASVGLNASAALLHVAALKFGPLTLVQPLGALTLVAAVPLGARLAGRRVSPLEWRGTGLTLIGLGVLLLTASGPEPDDTLSLPEAVAVAGVTTAVVGLLTRPGTRPGLRHATASGFASGVASALTQTVTVAATDRSGPVLDARVVVVALLVAAFAVGGLLLSQTAYRGGLGAPLAVVTLANPVAAAAIGVALLGERLRGGAGGVLLAATGALVAAYGVVVLTRSPQTAATRGPEQSREPTTVPAPAAAPAPSPAPAPDATADYLPSIPLQPEPAAPLRMRT